MEYLQRRADKQLENQLDHDLYNEAQLIEIKVPLNLPYQTNWAGYQRLNGEVTLNGIIYQYVKRKVFNDTLFLLCIPNMQKMRLETVKNDLFKLTIDFNQGDGSKKMNNLNSISPKSLQGPYDEYSFTLNINSSLQDNRQYDFVTNTDNLTSFPHLSPGQPPDSINS